DGTASNDRGKSTAGAYPSTLIKPEPVAPDNSAPAVARPDRVRVSQGVTSGLLIRQVAPVYPSEARSNHIQGTVLFQAIIGKDGSIRDLQVLSGPKELVKAATAAVQQWQYRPYLLMGEPVEVQTTIQINFQMR
ncbi:MAG TPA: energy transducer TonB, partial [Terriglobales bacterium]|nr:energy transducer TonB [Terriglobales bacterium]